MFKLDEIRQSMVAEAIKQRTGAKKLPSLELKTLSLIEYKDCVRVETSTGKSVAYFPKYVYGKTSALKLPASEFAKMFFKQLKIDGRKPRKGLKNVKTKQ